MPNRALIVAIENYATSEGLFSRVLTGTHQAARNFYRWLVDVKGLDRSCIFICSDGGLHDPQHPLSVTGSDGSATALIAGASRPEIIRAITSLIDVGQDKTEELYVYFSGHGFGYQISQYQLGVDVLITAEFHKQNDSGGACVKLDELRARLYMSVGGRDHYYFIDACRNVVPEGAIQVLGLGISPPLAQLGFPTMYILYSVKYGEASPVNAKFPTALKSGLSGAGHAKGWVGGEMYVKFDLLCDYVDDSSKPPRVDSRREGNGKGTLLKLSSQSVLSDCVIQVDGAGATDRFQLETISGPTSRRDAFTGPSFSMKLEPNDRTYSFRLTGGGLSYELYDPPATAVLDFYSSCVLKFRLSTVAARSAPEPVGAGELNLQFEPRLLQGAAPDWKIELESLRTGEVVQHPAGQVKRSVPAGAYVARVREDGVTAVRRLVRVQPGSSQTVDLLHRESTPTQEGILAAINANPKLSIAEFSETLGPTAHWDLQLWLAYLGSAHIMRRPAMYHKLGKVPLLPLDNVPAGQSAAFALVVAKGGPPKFGVHQSGEVSWSEMSAVQDIPELYQGVLPLDTGPTLISLSQADRPPLTFVSCGLPNRAALFVFAPDAAGHPGVQQFLLPLAHLQQQFRYRQEWWDQGPASNLKLVGLISLAQHRFALRRPAAPDEGKTLEIWRNLLNSKWTDPMLGLIALYDIMRGGQEARRNSPYPVELVLGNLSRYFGELPDVPVLGRVFRLKPRRAMHGVPLFLDGVLAARISELLPLPASHLDFNSAYTSWRNAVTVATGKSVSATQ